MDYVLARLLSLRSRPSAGQCVSPIPCKYARMHVLSSHIGLADRLLLSSESHFVGPLPNKKISGNMPTLVPPTAVRIIARRCKSNQLHHKHTALSVSLKAPLQVFRRVIALSMVPYPDCFSVYRTMAGLPTWVSVSRNETRECVYCCTVHTGSMQNIAEQFPRLKPTRCFRVLVFVCGFTHNVITKLDPDDIQRCGDTYVVDCTTYISQWRKAGNVTTRNKRRVTETERGTHLSLL